MLLIVWNIVDANLIEIIVQKDDPFALLWSYSFPFFNFVTELPFCEPGQYWKGIKWRRQSKEMSFIFMKDIAVDECRDLYS